MKQISLSTFLLLFTAFLFGQSEDFSILELKRGSLLSGKIISKSSNGIKLETALFDTLEIRTKSIKKQYLIAERFDYKGDVPTKIRGRYFTFSTGVGGGRQRINVENNPFAFFFSGRSTALPIIRYSPLIIARIQGSVGYQFNPYLGFGTGLIITYNDVELPEGILTFTQSGFRATPYVEGNFNYPLKGQGNKELWVNVNAFLHTEVVVGISFLQPKRRFNVGVGFFKGFNRFQADSYFSIQTGIQI